MNIEVLKDIPSTGLKIKDARKKKIPIRDLEARGLIKRKRIFHDKDVFMPVDVPKYAKRFRYLRKKYQIKEDGSAITDHKLEVAHTPAVVYHERKYDIKTVRIPEHVVFLTPKGKRAVGRLKSDDSKNPNDSKNSQKNPGDAKRNSTNPIGNIKE